MQINLLGGRSGLPGLVASSQRVTADPVLPAGLVRSLGASL
jgi:hypothetical protein